MATRQFDKVAKPPSRTKAIMLIRRPFVVRRRGFEERPQNLRAMERPDESTRPQIRGAIRAKGEADMVGGYATIGLPKLEAMPQGKSFGENSVERGY